MLLIASTLWFGVNCFAVPPLTKIKDGGGLFGYETVTEIFGDGSHTILCQGRGFIRCKASMGLTVLGDNDEIQLTDSEVEAIENQISDKVKSNTNSGVINFDSRVIVSFTYDKSTDRLVYTMYSISQAIEHSII